MVVPRKTVRQICEEVAAAHRITWREFVGPHRHKAYTRARQEAYWRSARETGKDLSLIGRVMHRDRTTVRFGISAHEARLANEARS